MDDLLELLNNLAHIKDFDRISISLASPEKIRSWSYGEIKTSETINYRTFKPENEGLFCAKTFGPIKNYECLCGKYKLFKHQGIVCEKCGVEVTQTSLRRKRMGHIELAAPIAHIWYLKSLPSRLGLLLDMSLRDVERVLYFESYIVIEPGATPLVLGQILSDADYLAQLELYGHEFKAQMGGEAIHALLRAIDLPNLLKQLPEQIKTSQSETLKKKLRKRFMLVQSFLHSGHKPEWMILKVLPVLPPDLRPLVQFEGARFVTSDLNELYRRVINRNNRTKRLMALKAPAVIIHNELRILQESVDALLDNGRRHKVFTGTHKLPLQSLSDMIKGKQGRFRQNLLGKRVDYSGRTVIIVNPSLKLHQCGIPKEMALELFKPFLFEPLKKRGLAVSIKVAKKLIEQKKSIIWDILKEVVLHHPVLLNRTPTLHRLGIQAFEPILIEEKAIQLHPLICKAFNAHFDGEQMAVHIPLSLEAQLEARVLMMSTHNILSPANGELLIIPSAEMVLGLYWITYECAGVQGEGKIFLDINEIQRAYDAKIVDIGTCIEVRLNHQRVKTTYGRTLVLQCLPTGFPFKLINRCLTQEIITEILKFTYLHFGALETLACAHKLMSLGFTYATRAGFSLKFEDMVIPKDKAYLIQKTQKTLKTIQEQYIKGIITDNEQYHQMVDVWKKTHHQIIEAVLLQIKPSGKYDNALSLMHDAGVESIIHINQLIGMCGLMIKSNGLILDTPITANFSEGLNVHQYFTSTHSARKKLSDTALKTANAGYLTRRLVDVAQDVIIVIYDCGTTEGLTISAVQHGISLSDRVLGRVLAKDVLVSKEKIITAGTLLNEEIITSFETIDSVTVRSPITCHAEQGVCALCYGRDLAYNKLVNIGEAVGVIAAQSIGESGTKLTLHSEARISQASDVNNIQINHSGIVKFDNLKVVTQQNNVDTETFLTVSQTGALYILNKKGEECERHQVPYGAILTVIAGEEVVVGQRVAQWDRHTLPIISEYSGYIRFMEAFEGGILERHVDSNTGLNTLVVKNPKLWTVNTRGWEPRINIVDKRDNNNLLQMSYYLPPNTTIHVEDGSPVNVGEIIAKIPKTRDGDFTNGLLRIIELFEARIPKEPAILALQAGMISFGKETKTKYRIVITDHNGQTEEISIPKWRKIKIMVGQQVELGDILVEGQPNPHDILHLNGINALVKYLIHECQEIYLNHGISINDKHFEVIIRQMLRTVSIVVQGDTPFCCGEIVTRQKLLDENERLSKNLSHLKTLARWKPKLLGITKASLATESFISAASFMDTTRVLLSSAIQNKTDNLLGLKENVIIGRLIPAGTGLSYHKGRK